ncbi:MAG: ferredoxin [Halocynthiibacter sp.]
MTFDAISHALSANGLTIRAALHEDGTTIVLLGPDEPAFWPKFAASPEYLDGAPDPLDRWSKRTLRKLAQSLDAEVVFPSDGPPYPPFFTWALASGWVEQSPVGMLVHPYAGLFVSFRGALIFDGILSLPSPPAHPCQTCIDKPCKTACPVGALRFDRYDTKTCRRYLDTDGGRSCMEQGCIARRACPISETYPRDPAQSAFHMKAFHPT